MAVRSVRNNNPGNIRSNATAWQGATGGDGSFVSFATPEHGVRALGKTLETYQDRHGLTDVEGMIQRWAPPNENDTSGYVDFVANKMGIYKNTPIDLSSNPELAEKMVSAMIQKEGADLKLNCGETYLDFDEKFLLENYKKINIHDNQGSHWAPHLINRSIWERVGGFSETFLNFRNFFQS